MARISKPNYTQVPDEVLDRWMAELTGAEFKVLLYICRRTFGFRRDADAISLEQFCDGIVTYEGKRLDHGTGLSRRAVLEALERLDELKIVLPWKTKGPDGRQQVTVYRLILCELGAESAPGPGALLDESRVQKSNPQETVERQTVESTPLPPTQAEALPPLNLTGSLQVVIGRHARRLGIKGRGTLSDKMLRQLEREDTGEDYRRALVHGLERFAGGDSRDSIGQWAYDWLQGWRRDHGATVRGHPGNGSASGAAVAPARGGYDRIVAEQRSALHAKVLKQMGVRAR